MKWLGSGLVLVVAYLVVVVAVAMWRATGSPTATGTSLAFGLGGVVSAQVAIVTWLLIDRRG